LHVCVCHVSRQHPITQGIEAYKRVGNGLLSCVGVWLRVDLR
jgi:hypothetical protein